MRPNLIAAGKDKSSRAGRSLRMERLSPSFDAEEHQLYLDLLRRAIADENVRNVALTGAYGSGKSSVLDALISDVEHPVVELSLSTINPEIFDRRGDVDKGDERATRTNAIQKELVKQLLYMTAPASVPRSRFRRATTTPFWPFLWKAAGVGAVVFTALLVFGVVDILAGFAGEQWWRAGLAYVFVGLGSWVVAAVVLLVVKGRPSITASVSAAGAAVTLSPESTSYFDEYLDEIVYFFERTERDVVVIQDVDRFEDVEIFDTLRALNGLLNGAAQVGRRIVFVYAIRDGVFKSVGRSDESAQASKAAEAAPSHALRAKFFV